MNVNSARIGLAAIAVLSVAGVSLRANGAPAPIPAPSIVGPQNVPPQKIPFLLPPGKEVVTACPDKMTNSTGGAVNVNAGWAQMWYGGNFTRAIWSSSSWEYTCNYGVGPGTENAQQTMRFQGKNNCYIATDSKTLICDK